MTNFNEIAWREKCQDIANKANNCSGLVYEQYQRNLRVSIDRLLKCLPEENHDRAKAIASEFGYPSLAELEDNFHGYCSHGLEPKWCPVGCGDIDL